jgi:DnaJ homolog subfamily A member 2
MPSSSIHTKLYQILDISPTSDSREIKKAYYRKAKTCHPDLNPQDPCAEEKFKALSRAYETLSDPQKRAHYDRFGEEPDMAGLHESSSHFQEMFESLFGHFGGFGFPSGPKKGKSIVHGLKLSLEEIYRGKHVKLKVERNEICSACGGDQKTTICPECGGPGVLQLTQLGIQMCPTCQGTGEVIPKEYRCGQCQGRKVNLKEKILEFYVNPGTKVGTEFLFPGESHQNPMYDEPGDIVIRVEEKPHSFYQRRNSDLHCTVRITLPEALAGTTIRIPYLDHTSVYAMASPIISPGDQQVILGKGLPPGGNIVVTFNVEFPTKEQLSPEILEFLSTRLPNNPPSISDDQSVEYMQPVHADPNNNHTFRENEEVLEEDVQCIHQ